MHFLSSVKKCVEALLELFDNKQYIITTEMLADKTSFDKDKIRICLKSLFWHRFVEPLKKEEGRSIVQYTFCDLSTVHETEEAKDLTCKNSEQIQNVLQKLILSVDEHKKKVFIKGSFKYTKKLFQRFSFYSMKSYCIFSLRIASVSFRVPQWRTIYRILNLQNN